MSHLFRTSICLLSATENIIGIIIEIFLIFSLPFFCCHLSEPVEGFKDWSDAVSTARIPCADVSSLEGRTMVVTLERASLKKYFQVAILN